MSSQILAIWWGLLLDSSEKPYIFAVCHSCFEPWLLTYFSCSLITKYSNVLLTVLSNYRTDLLLDELGVKKGTLIVLPLTPAFFFFPLYLQGSGMEMKVKGPTNTLVRPWQSERVPMHNIAHKIWIIIIKCNKYTKEYKCLVYLRS